MTDSPEFLGAARVHDLAARLGLRPTKQWGQNFVVDANTVRRIVRLAGVSLGPVRRTLHALEPASATFPPTAKDMVWEASQRRSGTRLARLGRLASQVCGARLAPQGFGEADPVADNATPQGQALNRRVTIILPTAR